MDRLRIAFVPGVTPDKWAKVWRERHPRIPLDLLPVEEEQARSALDDGTADLALVRLPVDLDRPTPLHRVVLYEEVPVVVAAADHFIAAADEVGTEDLAEEQLVLPERSGWRPTVDQLTFPPMSVKDAIETAAAGTGVAVLPMAIARLHHRKDVVHRPVRDLPPTEVALVWRREDDSPIHQDFVGITRGRRSGSGRG
ncbi:LysR substrate-binding domain-containing protein [Nocardioides stalactiti]|uniref:LysR substrate-binding domain-containing protein n=1 Tax=Nocardioides stalactiti TaxID=2755356 RepID=UPI0028A843B3|nr:LysR substrate-binding domain-containing protein [Nocardioides stalactiti]